MADTPVELPKRLRYRAAWLTNSDILPALKDRGSPRLRH